MSSYSHTEISLSAAQRLVLQELVTRHRESDGPIKGETVAEGIDRTPGTIRNQMQSLKALQLVDGIPGPQGGYQPTARAYEALSLHSLGDPAEVPLYYEGEHVEAATITDIGLTSVLHPENCQAEVKLQGLAAETFHEGDDIVVGPTPLSDLRIDGVIEGIDKRNSTLVIAIESMCAPADPPEL